MYASIQKDAKPGISSQSIVGNISVCTINAGQAVASRPLWLTEKEAESLLVLCTMSPASGGDNEQALFSKLSRYMRSFS